MLSFVSATQFLSQPWDKEYDTSQGYSNRTCSFHVLFRNTSSTNYLVHSSYTGKWKRWYHYFRLSQEISERGTCHSKARVKMSSLFCSGFVLTNVLCLCNIEQHCSHCATGKAQGVCMYALLIYF